MMERRLGAALCFAAAAFISCGRGETLVGVVAGLSGIQSELGVAGRNGAILRVEEANAEGGRFRVVAMDDRNDPAAVPGILAELEAQGVAAVIGPFTSSLTAAALEKPGKLLLISPTASAKRFRGHDDRLLRIMASADVAAVKLADTARDLLGSGGVVALWDARNRIYAEDYLAAFAAAWRPGAIWSALAAPELGSGVAAELVSWGFSSEDECLLGASAVASGASGRDALLIANGADAATMIRRLRRDGFAGRIMVAGWAVTSDLAGQGTGILNGVVFSQQYDLAQRSAPLDAFKERYRTRFGEEPSFGAVFGYEATDALLRAYAASRARDAEGLKRALLSLAPFEGLQGPFSFDEFGDPLRDAYVFEFRDGSTVRLR